MTLTAAQQNVLADFCTLARAVMYDIQTDGSWTAEQIGDLFCTTLTRHSHFTPQRYDELYDILHRTGANA